MPHAVAIAADASGETHETAVGPVTPESLFWLASMTKPITTLAALRLVERQALDLEAPVADYVPDFARLQVLEGFDDDNRPRLRPPKTQATVRQLLTHTSGLGYWFWNASALAWRRIHGTGEARLYSEPLIADPGTSFNYGISTDWLGRVIEAVSGESLDRHLRREILDPLGMTDTTFHPTPEQRARLVPVHRRDAAGGWIAGPPAPDPDPTWHAGGHGLFSTPRDYLRFQQTLLQPDPALETAFTPQTPFPARLVSAHPAACDFTPGPGFSWGLAMLLDKPQSGGWMGLSNTFFWVDRTAGTTAALYTQTQPFADPAVLCLAREVGALYA